MRYMVHFELTPEAGKKIEALPNGPKPFIEYLMESFKPECLYLCPTKRGGYLVTEVNDATRLAELMIVIVDNTGQYPVVEPVFTAAESGKVIGDALSRTKKAPSV